MESVWFCLVALLITVYVLLDCFDLGAGVVHFCTGRNEQERRLVLRSIGPVWDGNEVWLLAAGGTLVLAFPALYAAGFSGMYLGLTVLLWLLVLRGVAIELRNHLENALWKLFWDVVFAGASGLLVFLFGVAIGNVVRGVPLDSMGRFFLPLWTDFRVGPQPGLLDWYTVLVGLSALAALAQHGSLWVALKTEGPVRERARRVARPAWYGAVGMTLIVTGATFRIQPHVPERLVEQPWGFIFPALAMAGLLWTVLLHHRGKDSFAFVASCAYLAGMLASVAFGVYPYLLPSISNPDFALTVYNSAAGAYGLRVALWWWIPGVLLVGAYTTAVYRHFAGKVTLEEEAY